MRTQQYIYPPRAQGVLPYGPDLDDLARLGWQAQFKVNDSRTLLKYLPDNPDPELWSRHGTKLKDYQPSPELAQQLRDLPAHLGLDPDQPQLLDGGLLDKKHAHIKHHLALWDILVRDGQHLLGTTYRERYQTLWDRTDIPHHFLSSTGKVLVGQELSPNLIVPRTLEPADWPRAWAELTQLNRAFSSPLLEGLMLKDYGGRLESGRKEANNGYWQVRCRVATGRHRF